MKFEEHVEKIRLKVEDAVKNALDRCGITADSWKKGKQKDENIEVGNIVQLIESIRSEGKDWRNCYDEIADDYAFTLFNRLICMKVMEAHGLYPEMITRRQQHSGKSYGHYMWLETNDRYREDAFEGLERYLSWQFEQLSSECDLFHISIPLHMVPTATFCKEITDSINAVDADEQIADDVWKQGDILSQIYEIYNDSKRAALKAGKEKVEHDKVPVQSQIYTPEWVVRFLVDNSLGKMYLEMYPESELKKKHKIIGDFSESSRDTKALDEIRVADPCVGSGNFLLYCFDLFYEMYMDQIENYGADYSKREVPKIIIEKNLYGIDLDERAIQLTKAGLFIKAKTKKNSVHINCYNVVSAGFHLPEYDEIGSLFDAKFFSKQFGDLLKEVWGDLQQAHKYGSLLRIDEKFEIVKNSLREDIQDAQLSFFTYEKAAEFDLFEKDFYKKLGDAVSRYAVDDKKKFYAETASNAMTYLKILTTKYDVVASNPPYTDSADMGGGLHGYLEENYKIPMKFVGNLYATFYKRNYDMLANDGYMAMIHPLTFMYLSTYKDMRIHILNNMKIEIFVEYSLSNLFGHTMVDPAFYVMKKNPESMGGSYFISLDQYTRTPEEKCKKQYCLEALDHICSNKEDKNVIIIDQEELKKVEEWPFMYHVSSSLRKHFEANSIDRAGIKVVQGLATSSNERFVRLWWEVSGKKQNPINDKWYSYSKGGPYCKWYGNNWAMVNWQNDGSEIKSIKDKNGKQKSRPQNERFYKKKGITYTGSGSKGTTFRLQEEDSLFDVGGSCLFPTGTQNNLEYLMAFMNSRLSFYLIDCLNPTVNTQVGDLKRLPFVNPDKDMEREVSDYARECIETKRSIDSKYILNGAECSRIQIKKDVFSGVKEAVAYEIEQYVKIFLTEWIIDKRICFLYNLSDDDRARMEKKIGVCVSCIPVYKKALDEYISRVPLSGELKALLSGIETIDLEDGTADEMKEKIRANLYSNNNGMEDFCRNQEINPITVWYYVKSEGIIPQVKANELVFEWFVFALRDILDERQDGILSVTDTDTSIVQVLEEYADRKKMTSAQLFQMEEFLGKKIRDFIEKDFFVELMDYTNVFMYLPKTPFIWHLSSGENRGFEAFVSIYKWNADSLYKLKSNYISKRKEKLEFRKTQLGDGNTAQTLEEKERIDKQLKEIEQFVRKIDELIASGYDPKLDDGVGKNIAPLQEKKMLKVDVLNANQLNKYLKAEW